MWLMLRDSFLSIVFKDCEADELLVRSRRRGDIEKVFPDARVIKSTITDYQYRAAVKKTDVVLALASELNSIDYPNFKNSVQNQQLHDCYLDVWDVMARLQPTRPYSGVIPGSRWPSLRDR
jgi:hypothetical protein